MATLTCDNASRTEVMAKISMAALGDTVVVPAGTVDWTGDINIVGITLKGPGRNAASPTIITAGQVILTKHPTHNTKLTGFRFTGNSLHFWVYGAAADKPFIINDCYFFNDQAFMANIATNGGLISWCDFVATAHTADTFKIILDPTAAEASWTSPHSMGTADTNGDKNTYFEKCIWTEFNEIILDSDNGARVVIRDCIFNDSGITCHGGGSGTSVNDTSSHGVKHIEIYNNEFHRISNAHPVNKWLWMRGGTGVFANNSLDRADSPDGFSYTGKNEINLTVGCLSSSYPVAYQVGQVKTPAENPPSCPFLIFGNSGAGSTDTNFISVGQNPNPVNYCPNPGNFIQLGRDYMTSNSWGWVAYTYPHPLRDDTDGGDGGNGGNGENGEDNWIAGASDLPKYGAIYGEEISNIEVDLSGGGLDIKSRVGDEFEMGVFFDYADLTGYEFAALTVLDPPPLERVFPITVEPRDLSVGLILVRLTDTDTRAIGPVADKPWFLKWKKTTSSWRTILMGKLCLNRNY